MCLRRERCGAGACQGARQEGQGQSQGSRRRGRRRRARKALPRQHAKKKRQDPAEAQRAIEAALKLLEAGKAEPAAQALSAVLAGGNLPPAIMAKALFYRGVAYRQQKMPAQAIADLTSALWLKGGLGGNDRADAMRQRTVCLPGGGAGRERRAARPCDRPQCPARTDTDGFGGAELGQRGEPFRASAEAIGQRLESLCRLVRRLILAICEPACTATADAHATGHGLDRPIRAFLRHAAGSATHERMDAQHRGARQRSAAGRRQPPRLP